MVMGFIAGMLVLQAMCLIIGSVYPIAINGLQLDTTFGLFSFLASVIILVIMLMTTASRCFALNYQIPDSVLKWMNGGVESFGDADEVERTRGTIVGGVIQTAGSQVEAVKKAAKETAAMKNATSNKDATGS